MNKHLARMVVWLALLCPAMSAMAITATTTDGYARTRFPIVLVPGSFGFDMLLGFIDYWSDIPQQLRQGGAEVYLARLNPLAVDPARGEQLISQLENLQAVYGYRRFNLYAHSQGGLTARYVAAVRPDLVASVTTLSAPNGGSLFADGNTVLAPSGSLQRRILAAISDLGGELISIASGQGLQTEDWLAVNASMTTAAMTRFNALYPAGATGRPCGGGPEVGANGVRYYSLGGTAVLTNPLDPSDDGMVLTSLFFGSVRNDGLVGKCASHWGEVLRDDYPWNHLDAVNQIFGLRALFSPDPGEVYRAQANRLKQSGL